MVGGNGYRKAIFSRLVVKAKLAGERNRLALTRFSNFDFSGLDTRRSKNGDQHCEVCFHRRYVPESYRTYDSIPEVAFIVEQIGLRAFRRSALTPHEPTATLQRLRKFFGSKWRKNCHSRGTKF